MSKAPMTATGRNNGYTSVTVRPRDHSGNCHTPSKVRQCIKCRSRLVCRDAGPLVSTLACGRRCGLPDGRIDNIDSVVETLGVTIAVGDGRRQLSSS